MTFTLIKIDIKNLYGRILAGMFIETVLKNKIQKIDKFLLGKENFKHIITGKLIKCDKIAKKGFKSTKLNLKKYNSKVNHKIKKKLLGKSVLNQFLLGFW